MCDDNVTLHLMNGKNEFEDIYFHSLNVAVIAMMIGRAKGYSAEQLKALSFAALFHDMGKIKIPTAILRKQVPLTEPESNYLKLHTKYGLDMANQIEDFPDSAKTVIAQHHELRDGSGYPEGLKGDEIDELAQVIIVANAFDNLCHTSIAAEQKFHIRRFPTSIRIANTYIKKRTSTSLLSLWGCSHREQWFSSPIIWWDWLSLLMRPTYYFQMYWSMTQQFQELKRQSLTLHQRT